MYNRKKSNGQCKKYGNKKVVINGEKFDSEKEGKRYLFLLQKQKDGEIHSLSIHKKIELIPSVIKTKEKVTRNSVKQVEYVSQREVTWSCDFYYITNDGNEVYEDVKGSLYMISEVWKLKQKIMYYRYGIKARVILSPTEDV